MRSARAGALASGGIGDGKGRTITSRSGPPSLLRQTSVRSKSLTDFDSTIAEHFQELNASGDELAGGMIPDTSGEDVLRALENSLGEFKRARRLTAASVRVKGNLDLIRTRLIVLLESMDNALNEFASTLVTVAETGSVSDQRSSVLILDAMFRWEGMDLSQFEKSDSSVTVKFASLVRIVLTKNSERLALAAAARALGRLARVSDPSSRVDFVRFETVRAMEWLHLDAHINRRLAAVLILRYLTEMVPMLFVTHDHALSFFDRIGSALLDRSPETRFAARDAVQAFFALVNTREDQEVCFRKCYAIVRHGVETLRTAEAIHGSLLAIGELLRSPNDLLRNGFATLCHEILRFRSHTNSFIVRAVIHLIPRLAAYSQDFATMPHLHTSVELLIQKAKPNPADLATNEAALTSLGLLVSNLGSISSRVFESDFQKIVSVMRECLRNPDLAQHALVCLCFLGRELGGILLGESLSLLDDAFAYPAGLAQTDEFLSALEAFMPIPAARPLIRARLIHEVSLALTGKPFNVPMLIPRNSAADMEEEEDLVFFIQVLSKHNVSGSGNTSSSKAVLMEVSEQFQQAALRALGKFDFGPLNLLPFLKHRVCPFMESTSRLRTDACLACVETLSKQPQQQYARSTKSTATITEVVRGILLLATGDLDPAVRHFAMDLLRQCVHIFGIYLAQSWSLNMLFTSLNDTKQNVRVGTLKVLEGLADLNPGVILPFLRKYLISLVSTLKSASSKREEVETATILEELIRNFYGSGHRELGDALLQPFMETIVKELIHKMKNTQQSCAHLIQALGACAAASDPHKGLERHLNQALPLVIQAAFDSEAPQVQRESALATLTELLKRTEAIGVSPTNRSLVDPLLEIASAPPTSVYLWSFQREALRCLGTLGALDPSFYLKLANPTGNGSEDHMLMGTGYGKISRLAETHQEDEFGLNVLAVGRPSKRRRSNSLRGTSSEAKSFNATNHDMGFSASGRLPTLYFEDEENDDSEKEEPTEMIDDAASDTSSEQSDSEENLLPVRGPVAEYGSTTQEQLEVHFRLVAVQALTKILRTPALASFHAHVIEAAGNTCRSLGVDTVPYLSRLVPAMIRVGAAPRCDPELRRTTIKQLTVFISVMKRHMRPYLRDVLGLARMFWDDNLFEVLALVEETSSALKEEFVPNISWIVPKLILALRKVTDAGIIAGGASGGSDGKKLSRAAIDVPSGPSAPRRHAPSRSTSTGVLLNKDDSKKKNGSVASGARSDSIQSTQLGGAGGANEIPSRPTALTVPAFATSEDTVSRRALGTVQYLGMWISESEHSHRIAAEILDILESRSPSDATKLRGLEVLRSLCQLDTFTMDTLPLVRCIVKILSSSTNDMQNILVNPALDLFSVLLERSSIVDMTLEPFVQMLPERFRTRIQRKRTQDVHHARTNTNKEDRDSEDGLSVSTAGSVEESGNNLLLAAMISEVSKTRSESFASVPSDVRNNDSMSTFGPLAVNPIKLREALEASQATTEDDWSEWMRRFAVELLRESPDPTLRACASVAQAHNQLARDLFNAAFVSCWTRLSEDDRKVMVRTLKAAFKHRSTPPDVLIVLLNLCEFMEHNDRALPIEWLSEYAMRCHAYAKALHYKEMEFRGNKNNGAIIVDDLININYRLERPEAAQGLLRIAQNQATASVTTSDASGSSGPPPALTYPSPSSGGTGSPFATLGPRRRSSTANAMTVQVRETWYEQLGRWRDALESYDTKFQQLPEDTSLNTRVDVTVGSMRCMLSLGEYDKLIDVGRRKWRVFDTAAKQRMAPLIAHALWEKGADSTEMQQYLPYVDGNKLDGAVLNAVATIQRGDWRGAKSRLDEARRVLATELSTSVSESYARAYHQIVIVQQLMELEEVAQLRQNRLDTSRGGPLPSLLPPPATVVPLTGPGASGTTATASSTEAEQEDFERLRTLWDKRLRVCQRTVNVWQKLMAARILVVPPKEDAATWIKFVSICRREERWGLARSTLKRLGVVSEYDVGASLANGAPRKAIYAMLKLCWYGANDRPPAGDKGKAYAALNEFAERLTQSIGNYSRGDPEQDSLRRLVAKSKLKLGEWTSVLHGDQSRQEAMRHVEIARNLEPMSYKAAHAWASLNFLQFETGGGSQHLIEAIRAFFYSIALGRNMGGSTSTIMQDVLRLLTLWFDHAVKSPKAAMAIRDGFQAKRIPIGTWLNVVPQLIARIQSNPPCLRELLVELGSTYPQALVYPLTVAARSVDLRVRGGAEGILSELRTTQSTLLDQAALVARELIRVAILLPEEWYEGLEDACKAWYPIPTNEGEVRTPERAQERFRALKATQECLTDLNRRLGDYAGASRHEMEFLRKYGKNLERAAELIKLYEERRGWELPGKNRHMQEAWAEYKKIYAEIGEKYLKELSTLELEEISPMLLAQRNLELAVPGTFRADVSPDQLVKIRAFGSRVKVFPTKQRPRRIGLVGSNGFTYRYLLKGHEDLRQDERAMQLFGLVNVLLAKATLKKDLAIQTYIVIPLSPHVGLIGWLPQTDTLHSLIRKYRAEKRIQLNIEQQWSNKICPLHATGTNAVAAMRDPGAAGNSEGYDRLTLMQKVEAFEFSLLSNQGDDLAKVMWHKSRSAEVWLDRRTHFTRSLATMSMVGYILGLGDRHPSNLMLHRTSGRIVHIDFGDCFEVAAHRDKYPERVPFRLTRMLVNAMEVSGIEGNFRISCEAVMGVLRDNRDSVMAMLEAFVHDPLISWRLWAQQNETTTTATNVDGGAGPTNNNLGLGGDKHHHGNGNGGNNVGRATVDDEKEDEQVAEFLGRTTASPLMPVEEEELADVEGASPREPQQHPQLHQPQAVNRRQQQQQANHDEEDPDMAFSAKAMPIPPASSRLSRAGSVAVMDAESLAQSRRDRGAAKSLSQSYQSRAAREKARVRRFSVTFDEVPIAPEPVLNEQAVNVVQRVKDKLTGHDFGTTESMSVVDQVDKLIRQATAHENLATAFLGWCAFW